MAGELAADPQRLRDASRFVSGKAHMMRERLEQLDDTIGKRLLADGWAGPAAVSFDGVWTDWRKGAETVIAALDESARNLIEAANAYEMQDASFRESVVRVGLNLPGIGGKP